MTTTTKRKRSGKTKPEVRKMSMDDLEDIISRVGGALSEEELEKLRGTVETLAWLQQELGRRNVTVARLRSLLGISTSEKTSKILNRASGGRGEGQAAGLSSEGAASGSSTEPGKAKAKGHGRNGAASYQSAERVRVPHESLSSGDPCPICPPNRPGIVYTQGRPSVLVRIVGKAPLQASVYELERLRCNLCGKVFTAKLPPEARGEKYDATAVAMITLLKYGSGFPFHRLERLEGDMGIPLPASTQWDLVNTAADELTAVYRELMRQAAQGRVLHNDDTSMRWRGRASGRRRSERSGRFRWR
jgi:transposase